MICGLILIKRSRTQSEANQKLQGRAASLEKMFKTFCKHVYDIYIYIYIYIFSIHIDPSEKRITFLLSRPARSFLSLKVAEFVKQSRPNTLFEGWRVSSSTPALCGCTPS